MEATASCDFFNKHNTLYRQIQLSITTHLRRFQYDKNNRPLQYSGKFRIDRNYTSMLNPCIIEQVSHLSISEMNNNAALLLVFHA